MKLCILLPILFLYFSCTIQKPIDDYENTVKAINGYLLADLNFRLLDAKKIKKIDDKYVQIGFDTSRWGERTKFLFGTSINSKGLKNYATGVLNEADNLMRIGYGRNTIASVLRPNKEEINEIAVDYGVSGRPYIEDGVLRNIYELWTKNFDNYTRLNYSFYYNYNSNVDSIHVVKETAVIASNGKLETTSNDFYKSIKILDKDSTVEILIRKKINNENFDIRDTIYVFFSGNTFYNNYYEYNGVEKNEKSTQYSNEGVILSQRTGQEKTGKYSTRKYKYDLSNNLENEKIENYWKGKFIYSESRDYRTQSNEILQLVMTRYININGTIFYEQKDDNARLRNTNGDWSEWKSFVEFRSDLTEIIQNLEK